MNKFIVGMLAIGIHNTSLAKELIDDREIKIIPSSSVTQIYTYDYVATGFHVVRKVTTVELIVLCGNSPGAVTAGPKQELIYIQPGMQVRIRNKTFNCTDQ